jgi:hypothetical protein
MADPLDTEFASMLRDAVAGPETEEPRGPWWSKTPEESQGHADYMKSMILARLGLHEIPYAQWGWMTTSDVADEVFGDAPRRPGFLERLGVVLTELVREVPGAERRWDGSRNRYLLPSRVARAPSEMPQIKRTTGKNTPPTKPPLRA